MRLAVLVLEDEPDVREALERDLEPLAKHVRVEPAEDAADARAVIREIAADHDLLAVVLADHRLPGTTGVDFLVELANQPETAHVATVLVTGQADHQDTIRAVNQGGLDYYLAKPWAPEELRSVVRTTLTDVVEQRRLDPLPHLAALDAVRAMELVRRRSE
ncbi:response regulator [Ornithinimicrobium pratense]|uniref:Response regulator n=1 Tax=Ornithinimicrobium pratense TaxID=2593973 RepID=A0A5J6V2H0_9MICO|nr:response regulator [Ornithinimicrobium pratense]QFG67456.1 response regulator [Ornithinimicrobium pratense]